MLVLDTHVWVWWVSGVEPLPPKARRLIRAAREQKAIYLSSISVWEVGAGLIHARSRSPRRGGF